MTDSEWSQERQEVEVLAWARFVAALQLAPALFVSLYRIAFRHDR